MAKSSSEGIGLPGRGIMDKGFAALVASRQTSSHTLLNILMGDPLFLKTAADNNCRDKITILCGYDF